MSIDATLTGLISMLPAAAGTGQWWKGRGGHEWKVRTGRSLVLSVGAFVGV